jgi:hypothetical protein
MTKFLKKLDFSLSRYKVKNGIYFLYLYVIFGLAGFELVFGLLLGRVKPYKYEGVLESELGFRLTLPQPLP